MWQADRLEITVLVENWVDMLLPELDVPGGHCVSRFGLVEHFDRQQTREAVLAQLDVLRPGGTAITMFPTPTLLYRVTRKMNHRHLEIP